MRFAAVSVAGFVCSNIYAQNKIDAMLKPPPPPTDVNVLNFPDVQAVGGTVNIGNLPLADDGALRVTSADTRQPVLIELAPGGVTVESQSTYISPIVDVAGYSRVGFHSTGNWYVPTPMWRWAGAPADDFGTVMNSGETHDANASCAAPQNDQRLICSVSGVQLRFRLFNYSAVPVRIESLRVYLIP